MMIVAMFCGVLAALVLQCGSAVIHGVHLMPLLSLNEMRVTYSSDSFTASSFVIFGTSKKSLIHASNATVVHFDVDSNSAGVKYVHNADMVALEPSTEYFYQCIVDEEQRSDIWSFTTIQESGRKEPFNAIIMGDLGHNGGPLVHKLLTALPAMEREVASGGVDMTIHMGDFAYDLQVSE